MNNTERQNENHEVWLSPEAYERLKAELDELTGEGRREIAQRIEAAREEGDLKENGGYHAAKDEQGKMEARIRDLEELLSNAVVGEAPKSDGVVRVGTVITVNMFGEEERFLFGTRELSEATDLNVYSPESPLGKVIEGLKVGDRAEYNTPTGKTISVNIVNVETYHG